MTLGRAARSAFRRPAVADLPSVPALDLSSSLSMWEVSRRRQRGEGKQQALGPRGAGPPAQARPQRADGIL